MATNQKFIGGFQVNRHLLAAGAALTGVGAMIGLAGTVIVGVALASAGRGWVQQLETPPGELAARTLNQARAASMAGLDAWRHQGEASPN
ncbi:hypothetical protein CFP65_3358 [Kitasatospora sp. MMS16-BH015]|uniref:hypothetical protein n=1 Tax=Kitasatospora sp. MMS16-BH015 TaxID=2018025 RepID=UPI000CA181A5|nr:hypothetical protein [Kitasatospora sp. MMS16-BH015]AUG78154.1 hypothetical protein CFP65_3358 [Kitasatospora sp. MMS16-BH015]